MDPAILPVLIPSVISFVGIVVGYFLLRRTGKESNDTTAFSAVTDQLFGLNKLLTEQVLNLEKKVKGLEENRTAIDIETKTLEGKLESVESDLRELKVVNGALSRYLGKLIRLWPQGTPIPESDEPVNWGAV